MTDLISKYNQQLQACRLAQRRQFIKRLQGAMRQEKAQQERILTTITQDLDAAVLHNQKRLHALPKQIDFPEHLPVNSAQTQIIKAIQDNPVLIIAGETGSGKTTQLPKLCLAAGRGLEGFIGHTQPRRLAASSVAARIAEELNTDLGDIVGYKVRFHDKCSPTTTLKLMTDGILLNEIQRDRLLLQYDTLIIDEAHERSLNIDFILGYLKQLLPKRPDLKIIITSATIDVERFSKHFNDAPVIEVSGRTYPVDIRYYPQESGRDDPWQQLVDAVEELCLEGSGDILIFQSGEREIRDTAEGLAKLKLKDTQILPLFARMPHAQQQAIFQKSTGRRIVLATNIAETSLTVPGIRYVIDPGYARISRYAQRSSVQQLPIEPISQASANQRAGRCGRVAAGVCIRLYSEEDFTSRPQFTDPEILRTHLAHVILQLFALNLGNIEAFPFIQEPEKKQIQEGLQCLEEIGALTYKNNKHHLTQTGSKLSRFPIDPRIGRMILASSESGCLPEVLIITAALSIQDPRERPMEAQQAADQCHSTYQDPESDFISFLNLWRHLQEQNLSATQLRKYCKGKFLSYLRIREWQDLHAQLGQICSELKLKTSTIPAKPDAIHRAILSGIVTQVGFRDPEAATFTSTRNRQFFIFPGSGLFKKPPKWVMSAQLTQTSKLFARLNAKIVPQWVEDAAKHLVTRQYNEPFWSKRQGAAMAMEKTSLYGLVLHSGRRVNYSKIDPELSRELLIREGLVAGNIICNHKFFAQNRDLLEAVSELEHKRRRHDILVDEQTLFEFYDKRLPSDIVSTRHFETWWKKAQKNQPDLLSFTKELVTRDDAAAVTEADYPTHWQQKGLSFPLSYHFEIGHPRDGVCIHIPLVALNRVEERGFEWLIPGLRHELVVTLLKSLPKSQRRNFVPAPEYARALLERMHPDKGALYTQMQEQLRQMTGVRLPDDAFKDVTLPDHLHITFQIEDEHGKVCATGKSLSALQHQLKDKVQQNLSKIATANIEKTGLTEWNFGPLPKEYKRDLGGFEALAYPALQDKKDSVSVILTDNARTQEALMHTGFRRLILLGIASPISYLQEKLSNTAKLGLHINPYGNIKILIDDCITCACDALIIELGGPAWDGDTFFIMKEHIRGHLNAKVLEIVNHVQAILAQAFTLKKRIKGKIPLELSFAYSDIQAQLDDLVYKGFVTNSGAGRLPDILRYLRGIEKRLEKIGHNAGTDRAKMAQISQLQERYQSCLDALPTSHAPTQAQADIRWMIEELRISFFAQSLGTAFPVSEKRIQHALDEFSK